MARLRLILQAERRPRELVLGEGLAQAIDALQRRLDREGHAQVVPILRAIYMRLLTHFTSCGDTPDSLASQRDGLRHVPFDFKRESKRKGGDIMGTIERIAAHMVLQVIVA